MTPRETYVFFIVPFMTWALGLMAGVALMTVIR